MDARAALLHDAACRALTTKIEHLKRAADILVLTPAENLTEGDVREAYDLLTADLPCPLRATVFDLARALSGSLPAEEVVLPPADPLRIFSPTGS